MYVANAMMIFRTICQYPGITQADLPDKIYELHGVDFRTSLVCHKSANICGACSAVE